MNNFSIKQRKRLPFKTPNVFFVSFRTHQSRVTCDVLQAEPSEQFVPCATRESSAVWEDLIAEEMQTPFTRQQDIIARMQRQREVVQKECRCGLAGGFQIYPAVCEEDKVVAIAQIAANFQRVLHEPVEFMQVNIRKNLARDIANGYSTSRADWNLSDNTAAIASNYFRKQRKRALVADSPFQQGKQHALVNIIEKLPNVPAPEPAITKPMQEVLRPFDGLVESLLFATRPRVEEKHRVIYFLQMVVEKPMDEAVFDGSNGDRPFLGIADGENLVRPMTVRALGEFSFQRKQILFQSVTEFLHFRCVLLSGLKP